MRCTSSLRISAPGWSKEQSRTVPSWIYGLKTFLASPCQGEVDARPRAAGEGPDFRILDRSTFQRAFTGSEVAVQAARGHGGPRHRSCHWRGGCFEKKGGGPGNPGGFVSGKVQKESNQSSAEGRQSRSQSGQGKKAGGESREAPAGGQACEATCA